MVRYYGYYSNVSRGKRRKEAEDAAFPEDTVYGDPDYPWDAYIAT
jgi:hypothetical protein